MKVNEAPEKIYLDEDESWHLTNPNGDSVEYTRTDAFIEKACSWLKNNLQGVVCGSIYIEDFKKAINL